MVANARGGAAAAGECMVSDSAGTGESYGGESREGEGGLAGFHVESVRFRLGG